MADGGAAVVIPDADLTPERLRAEVDGLLADPARLQAMGRASAALARPDAAQRIAAELLRGRVMVRHVGPRGDRAEQDRADDEEQRGHRAPAIGTDVHRAIGTRLARKGCGARERPWAGAGCTWSASAAPG